MPWSDLVVSDSRSGGVQAKGCPQAISEGEAATLEEDESWPGGVARLSKATLDTAGKRRSAHFFFACLLFCAGQREKESVITSVPPKCRPLFETPMLRSASLRGDSKSLSMLERRRRGPWYTVSTSECKYSWRAHRLDGAIFGTVDPASWTRVASFWVRCPEPREGNFPARFRYLVHSFGEVPPVLANNIIASLRGSGCSMSPCLHGQHRLDHPMVFRPCCSCTASASSRCA